MAEAIPLTPRRITAHDARDTDDGFVEHRALFSCKEIR